MTECPYCGRTRVTEVFYAGLIYYHCSNCTATWDKEKCSHEWHADQDNDCNTCIKCGARQEIYTE